MSITHDFCEAIAKRATEFITFPFPQVVGAIDGSHIALKTVPKARLFYRNPRSC